MNKQPKQLKYLVVVFGLLIISLIFLFRKTPWSEVSQQLRHANWFYVLIAIAAMGLFFLCEAVSLKQLFHHFRYRVPLKRAYGYALIDFYYSSITPGCSGGQPAQIFYMSRDKIAPGISSVSLLCFNLSYHVSALLLGGFGVIYSRTILQGHPVISWLLVYGMLAQGFLVLLFGALLIDEALVSRVLYGVLKLASRIKLIRRHDYWHDKLSHQIQEYHEASEALRAAPWLLVKTIAITTVHLTLFYSIPYLLLRAFDYPVNYLDLLTLQACLQLAMESLPIPGGLGVTEASFLSLYGGLIGGEKIVGILLLSRLISYSLGLISGGITSLAMVAKPKTTFRRARPIKPIGYKKTSAIS